MPTVELLSVEEIRSRRVALLLQSPLPEAELRQRAGDYLLSPAERALLDELDELDYLLGG